jgi:hypothetical protein
MDIAQKALYEVVDLSKAEASSVRACVSKLGAGQLRSETNDSSAGDSVPG